MWVNALSGGGGGDVHPWTPAQITTSLWLDAGDDSTITEVSGTASALADKSGNGYNAGVSGSTRRPTIVTNGQNGNTLLRFNGTSNIMTMPGAVGLAASVSEANTIIAAKITANSSGTFARVFNFSIGLAANTSFRHATSAISNSLRVSQRRLDADTVATLDYSYSATANAVFHARSVWSSATVNYRVNGGTETSSATGHSTGSTDATNSTEVALGGNETGANQFCAMDFYEMITIIGSITEANRQKIEGYLAWKWGLVSSLPSTHPYKSQRPLL